MNYMQFDQELRRAIELVIRAIQTYEYNAPVMGKVSNEEYKQYHANLYKLWKIYKKLTYASVVSMNEQADIANSDLDDILQELNNFIISIDGNVSNVAIANQALDYLTKLLQICTIIFGL